MNACAPQKIARHFRSMRIDHKAQQDESRAALMKAAFAMQEGKRNLPEMRKLLDAFVPTTMFEQRMMEALSDGLKWREAAVREGRTYPTL